MLIFLFLQMMMMRLKKMTVTRRSKQKMLRTRRIRQTGCREAFLQVKKETFKMRKRSRSQVDSVLSLMEASPRSLRCRTSPPQETAPANQSRCKLITRSRCLMVTLQNQRSLWTHPIMLPVGWKAPLKSLRTLQMSFLQQPMGCLYTCHQQ